MISNLFHLFHTQRLEPLVIDEPTCDLDPTRGPYFSILFGSCPHCCRLLGRPPLMAARPSAHPGRARGPLRATGLAPSRPGDCGRGPLSAAGTGQRGLVLPGVCPQQRACAAASLATEVAVGHVAPVPLVAPHLRRRPQEQLEGGARARAPASRPRSRRSTGGGHVLCPVLLCGRIV